MRVSVSMYSVNARVQKENWTTVDFLNYAKEIGLGGVELLDIYWKDKENEIAEVVSKLREMELQVSAYDVTNNFVKESAEERTLEVEKINDGIEVAKKLGTNIVRVFCGDLHGNLTYEDGQDWIVEGLKRSAEKAEREQVYLAIENHGLLAGKSEQVEEIIEKVNSPYVKSTFDTGNFLLVHEEPEKAFDKLREKIVHVHFKDFRIKDPSEQVKGFRSTQGVEVIGTIPGEGQVNLSYIVNGLNEIGYDGWLSIEYEGKDDPKVANEEAVRRLRKLLK
ncbi:sugar phosphate isomerase/epimerase [Aquibacillus sp. 3ASR75-11]|uniref:Sugar phosphate isomerase/epimerase n=1 Tax=Terrihalobacillus insolitus TaxID=2950438 RepID=A0A9X4AKS2_9BACI|nr:sugar phosphate isomerase/epimerase family protein [Terrihalobacillus insolitus]MDC3412177.1 sugar phosphate isomerase/epimerase [Terrihalobacillus insolitus]MDC3423129.1 sugar phosphate isomerase/epimerase [Terrihalobacillus insolitus]